MDFHGNHAFTHFPNRLIFEDGHVSHLGGPNKQFGTDKKFPGGAWLPKMASRLLLKGKITPIHTVIYQQLGNSEHYMY